MKNLILNIDREQIKGARFAKFIYENQNHEISEYLLILGVDFRKAYKRDIKILNTKVFYGDKEKARLDILKSLEKSLEVGLGNNPKYKLKDYFEIYHDGLKIGKSGDFYLTGYVVSKKILKHGEYKKSKFNEVSALKRELRCGRIRNFKLQNVKSVTVNGKILVIQ